MIVKGEKQIDAYVDAVRGLRALERAVKMEPAVDRTRALKQAKVLVTERIRVLTGGQIGEAKRRLVALTPGDSEKLAELRYEREEREASESGAAA